MNLKSKPMNEEHGVVLLLTMVVLLVLAAVGYQLANRVASQRHRDGFIIDYTAACYARDSAIKYAMTVVQDINSIVPIERPNEPDFSDLFAMSEEQYQHLLRDWAAELQKQHRESEDKYDLLRSFLSSDEDEQQDENIDINEDEAYDLFDDDEDDDDDSNKQSIINRFADTNIFTKSRKLFDSNGPNDINEANEPNEYELEPGEPNFLEGLIVRGPYGPQWPLVTEPIEIEIGRVKVKIEIEDENAKYPVGWGILSDEKAKRESEAGLDTFCEWMGLVPEEIEELKTQFEEVASIKQFQVEFKSETQAVKAAASPAPPAGRRGTRRRQPVPKPKIITPAEQMANQARDFSRLFSSALINTDILARPTIESEDRRESALKYMSMWGTTQVNVNTAPRQVLESAFVFGGDAARIASEIIKKRKQKPFASMEELKKELLAYGTSIDRAAPYITTSSNIFSVHITATCGAAKSSTVIVVLKEAGKIEKITVVSG